MINFDRILCPTDLTSESNEALRYAVALAAAFDSQLFVLHCIEKPEAPYEESLIDINDSITAAVENQLKCGQSINIKWESVILVGNPTEVINNVAAENRVNLIVIRSRHRTEANRLFGSTTEAVCRTSPCPVLVTHENEREWAGKFTRDIDPGRILVAYDFSDDAELALSYGLALAEQYQTELHLLNVINSNYKPGKPELAYAPQILQSEIDAKFDQLRNVVPEEASMWCNVKFSVSEGKPYSTIISYAQEHEIDLICMGVKGADFCVHTLFGSNVDRVLRQSSCPVLIARPLKPAVTSAETLFQTAVSKAS